MKFIKKYDLIFLLINLISIISHSNVFCINSYKLSNNTAKNILLKTNKANLTTLITDKVDLDIKKLDIKLEKLTKMIETFEKLGNVTTKEPSNRIKTIKIKTFNSQNTTNSDVQKEISNNVIILISLDRLY